MIFYLVYGLGFFFYWGVKFMYLLLFYIFRFLLNLIGNENYYIFYLVVIWLEYVWEKEIFKIRDILFFFVGYDSVKEEVVLCIVGIFLIKVFC